ncbi:MAG: DUF3352 domain-containing protein, partial [Candidatus Brocadiae bacterium]|nr:DUF3352 domain-containing protein [Candidatus Brocadiia bacterium]
IGRSRIGRHMQESPLLSSALNLWREALHFGGAFLADLPATTVDRLLGREAVVVVFESSGAWQTAPSVALVMDLGGDAELAREALQESALPRLQAQDSALSVTRQAGGVIHVRKGTQDAYVRFAGDLLVIGTEEAVAKFDPSAPTPAWPGEQGAPDGIASSYLDLQPVWDMVASNPAQMGELAQTGFHALKEFRASTEIVDGGFKDTIVAAVRPEGGLLPALMGLESGGTRSAAVVPQSYVLLLSFQIESGERLYGLIEEVVTQTQGEIGLQQFRMAMDQIDQAFAVNVEWELLPGIGNEVFFAVRSPDAEVMRSGGQPDAEDMAPIFGFVVNDADSLRGLIERFTASPQAAQQGWQLITEAHQDVELYTLTNIAGPAGFSFAFLEGFFVGAPDADMVRSVITAVTAGKTLANEGQYQAVSKHLPAGVNASAYLDTRQTMQALMELLPVTMQRGGRAFAPLVRQVVPELGGYGLAVVADEDELRVETYGELPVAFSLFSAGALAISVQVQRFAEQAHEPLR